MLLVPLVLSVLAAAPAPRQALPLPAPETPLGLPPPPAAGARDTEVLAALGTRLFFDPILSSDGRIACASCHRPELGFADDVPFSRGVHERRTTRNTPSLENRAYGASFFWDGRAATLEEQVLLPIQNPLEMDLSIEEALARLAGERSYREDFERALAAPPSADGLARALSAYVRRILRAGSPVDRFRDGEFAALDDAERAGLWFYESRGGCWRCHGGPNFTDEGFHNTGVGLVDGLAEPGRAAVTGRAEDHGRFKTPSLRGLARTAPYMHDGSLATLEEVVAFYRRGGNPNPDLAPELGPLEMSDEDAGNLVAFLRALSREDVRSPGKEASAR